MPGSQTADDLADVVSRASFDALLWAAEAWARLDVTMPQLKVLMLLGRHSSAPVSWLAGRMRVSPPNVTGILDRLEQHGWVRRTADAADRRVVRVVLTDAGRAFLGELRRAAVEQIEGRLVQMKAADRRALRQGLLALIETGAMDGAAEPVRDVPVVLRTEA